LLFDAKNRTIEEFAKVLQDTKKADIDVVVVMNHAFDKEFALLVFRFAPRFASIDYSVVGNDKHFALLADGKHEADGNASFFKLGEKKVYFANTVEDVLMMTKTPDASVYAASTGVVSFNLDPADAKTVRYPISATMPGTGASYSMPYHARVIGVRVL
jgi:hypothetical protein